MNLLDVAKRVKAGARFLDKIVPGWRKVLRAHARSFDIQDGAHCVLGTLEHYSRQMQNLNKKRVSGKMTEADYWRAKTRLQLHGKRPEALGFDSKVYPTDPLTGLDPSDDYDALNDLWRAEFSA